MESHLYVVAQQNFRPWRQRIPSVAGSEELFVEHEVGSWLQFKGVCLCIVANKHMRNRDIFAIEPHNGNPFALLTVVASRDEKVSRGQWVVCRESALEEKRRGGMEAERADRPRPSSSPNRSQGREVVRVD